jgi:phosphoserine phosphatase
MLSVVGHPAAVNPDKKLKQLALAYQWPIVDLDAGNERT